MDYKNTLNLPKTEFPMKANLPHREPELLAWWDQERLYDRIQAARHDAPLYVLHDGPPYANGRIHIGHAFNKILKDIIIKSKTMAGFRVPYVPGWDCHGLPIEHQVLKDLGSKHKDLDTLSIRTRCREYADKFYRVQRDEFRRLGVQGDWDHPYLTMDPAYEAAIIREFGKFVRKGGVYKGLKPVLWCTVDRTALAEAEVEYAEHTSPSIYVKFPVVHPDLSGLPFTLPNGSEVSVVIWTTTPWTLPANQAVCLNPDFDYAFVQVGLDVLLIAHKLVDAVAKACEWSDFRLLGVVSGRILFEERWVCRRPVSEGHSPLLLGDFVTLEQGTGCVHIAPGHGQEDYGVGMAYNSHVSEAEALQVFAPVDDRGCFTTEVPAFAGQYVLQANPHIIDHLQTTGRLVGQGAIVHSYPHCWRCKNPVIFRATEQWFVSMATNDLRARALAEIERVQWIPPWGRDRIHGMISSRPDWCLSRQRAWGTPIPGFTCTACRVVFVDPDVIDHIADLIATHGADYWFTQPASGLIPTGTKCPSCGGQSFEKERDILDVWFESGVSYAAVLQGRVEPSGQGWWPADLYLEGSDQHRGWFHSALLAGVMTDDRAPYHAVLTHGFVVDGAGKKMSKSAGNVVAPQDVIQQSGAEILRLWVSAQDYREDLRISKEILTHLSEAYRKIRNTCRFLLSNLHDFEPSRDIVAFDRLPELDRWALLRLGELIPRVRAAYDQFEFHTVFHALNNFCSVDMSAMYLDILKDRLYTFHQNHPLRRGSQTVLLEVLTTLTKLMAPVLAFTAEEIWRMLPETVKSGQDRLSVHVTTFPQGNDRWQDGDLAKRWDRLLAVRAVAQGALEHQRREKVIGSSLEATVVLTVGPELYQSLRAYEADLPTLMIVSHVDLIAGEHVSEAGHLVYDAQLGLGVDVCKAEGVKCERCWNYRTTVGCSEPHSTLCRRCVEALH